MMKTGRQTVLLGAALLLAASSAWADGRHHGGTSVGIYVGPEMFWGPPVYRPYYPRPYYYPAPYYAPLPIVVQPAPPPVYIEQSKAISEPPPAANYWYYCRDTNSYYPYVKTCKSEWQKVLPTPEN
jgi:hypothetical protein